jgi:uncharacterized membrane protein YeaQ/YmgE (transglycosylase-associated protein family)
MSSLSFALAIVLSAFFVGALARFALPGPDPMPAWLTVLIGLVGSAVGAVVGDVASNGNGVAVSFVAFGVSIALVAAYRVVVQKRPIFGSGALKFPERGIGVAEYRARLRRAGIDPDRLHPDPHALQEARLRAAVGDLHRAGILDDEENETLLARVNELRVNDAASDGSVT